MSYSRFKVLPRPQGPFSTGCTDLMFGRTQQGTLMRLYYPSSKELVSDKSLAPWFLGYEYTKGIAKFAAPVLPSVFETLFNWSTKDACIPCGMDFPVADGGPFPLVLFSHGLSAHRALYSTVCNDIASHGFIVAAIEHRDESACASFTLSEGGEKVWLMYRSPDKGVKQHPLRSKQVHIRATECSHALDTLERLTRGEIERNELPSSLPLSAFEGRIDASRPILAGHSFGGSTALLTLAKDLRFVAGLALDPWMFPLKDQLPQLASQLARPMMFILTESFQDQVNFKAFAPFDLDQNTFVTLKGSVHQNQSDTPFLFGFVGRAIGGCWSSLDKNLAMVLNNRIMVNFICRQLGIASLSPMVDVMSGRKHLLIGLHREPVSPEVASRLLFTHCVNRKSENNLISRL